MALLFVTDWLKKPEKGCYKIVTLLLKIRHKT